MPALVTANLRPSTIALVRRALDEGDATCECSGCELARHLDADLNDTATAYRDPYFGDPGGHPPDRGHVRTDQRAAILDAASTALADDDGPTFGPRAGL